MNLQIEFKAQSLDLPQGLPGNRSSLLQLCLKQLDHQTQIQLGDNLFVKASPLSLIRAVISIGQQLAAGARQARALLHDSVLIAGYAEQVPGLIFDRVLIWDQQSLLSVYSSDSPQLKASFNQVSHALKTAWQAYEQNLLQQITDPVLLEAWQAQVADVSLLDQQHQKISLSPAASQDFFKRFEDLTGQSFPFPELVMLSQRDDSAIWRGPDPDWSLPLQQRILKWHQQAQSRQAFLIFVEDQRFYWLNMGPNGASVFEDYLAPEDLRQTWSFEPFLKRLRFFGRYHAQFCDGLALIDGQISPSHEPQFKQAETLSQSYVLKSLDGQTQIQISSRAELRLGRDPACEVRLTGPTMGRQHAQISNQKGICRLKDIGSPAGVSVNSKRLNGSVVLIPGDQVDLGGQSFIFRLAELKHRVLSVSR